MGHRTCDAGKSGSIRFSQKETRHERFRRIARTAVASTGLRCFSTAVLALCCGFLWEYLTVHRNYGGNWTALFCIGDEARLPPELQGSYRFPGSTGFDGQYYYVIALDPAFQHGTDTYIDYPGLRYHRILVPAIAHLLAIG